MSGSNRLPFGLYLRRRILQIVFRPVFKIMFRVKISGEENIPLGESYLLAANHVSLFEPPFILAFWPELPEAVAGHDVWERPGQGLLVKWYGAIPVRRGEYDRKVIERMLSTLNSARPLMIFPEGGRSHHPGMRRALPGVAYLVNQAGVPILPVAIAGTRDDSLKESFRGRRPLFKIRIGKPFRLPPIDVKGEARREARQRNADRVMLSIAELLPEEYHGVYSGQVENFPES